MGAPGFFCAELQQQVGPAGLVVGVDSSPAMLVLAARRCEGRENVELHEADATSLPVARCQHRWRGVRPGPRICARHPGGSRRAVPGVATWRPRGGLGCRLGHGLLAFEGPGRITRVLGAWDEHLAHPSLPRVLAPAMRSAGFEGVKMEPHAFATARFDPDSYDVAIIPAIRSFVSGRRGVSGDEAGAWGLGAKRTGRTRRVLLRWPPVLLPRHTSVLTTSGPGSRLAPKIGHRQRRNANRRLSDIV